MARGASLRTSARIPAVTTGAVVLLGVAIIVIGLRFLLDPAAAAAGFGVPARPDDPAYLAAKGVRDIVSGLAGLTLLAVGHRRAAGWFLVVTALVPLGDAAIAAIHGASVGFVLGVHGATAAMLVVVGTALVRQGHHLA